jgi:hypothetical protein
MRIQMLIGMVITWSSLVGGISACSRSHNDGAKVKLVSVNDPEPGEVPAPRSVSFPPNVRHLLPVSQASRMLHPCSREAPQATTFWEPSEAEIDILERQLVIFMRAREQAQSTVPPPGQYGRQYVGFFRNGKPYIYGNYYPDTADKYQSLGPLDVCDGGRAHWSLVFNPKASSFSELNFSGAI